MPWNLADVLRNAAYSTLVGQTPDQMTAALQDPTPSAPVAAIRALYPNYSQDFDKLEHAYASYLMSRRLGYYPALTVGGLKELVDVPTTGFSLGDLTADVLGANVAAGYQPSVPMR